MKVILQEDIKGLGRSGDIVDVKRGFARNYLFPRSLAIEATVKNVRILENQRKLVERRIAKRKREAHQLRQALDQRSITIPRAVGKDDKIYGSVTARDIEKALREENIIVDRRNIILEENIKSLGVYPVKVKVGSDEPVEIKVWVVAQ